MTDKEERIFIRKGTAIELCKFIYRDGCAGEMHCCSCDISIPRSEVIEKIAKALFLKTNKGDNWADYKKTYPNNGYIDDAEAALNSLLEDKK